MSSKFKSVPIRLEKGTLKGIKSEKTGSQYLCQRIQKYIMKILE